MPDNTPELGTRERPYFMVAMRDPERSTESNEAGAFAAGFMLGGAVVLAVILFASWSMRDVS